MKRTKFRTVILWLLAITAFIQLSPYFMWTTYYGGIFAKINAPLLIVNFLLLGGYAVQHLKKNDFTYGVATYFLLTIFLYQNFTGKNHVVSFNLGGYVTIFIICLFLISNDQDKKDVFDKFMIIYAVSLISGIFVFVLTYLGVDLPYDIILSEHQGKQELGFFYLHYPGSAFLNLGQLSRLSGMFDEPGVVGTISAFLLAGDDYRLKNSIRNKIIFIGGCLSFSLAFYILTIFGIAFKYYKRGMVKFSLTLVAFVLLFSLLMSIKTDNQLFNKYFKEKFFVEEGLFRDNRETITFEYEFNKFLHGDTATLIFGNGEGESINNPLMFGSFSYKMLIYDYGLIGTISLIGWFTLVSLKVNKGNLDCLGLLVIFLLSMYQRPYVISIPFILILFGGFANLKHKQERIAS